MMAELARATTSNLAVSGWATGPGSLPPAASLLESAIFIATDFTAGAAERFPARVFSIAGRFGTDAEALAMVGSRLRATIGSEKEISPDECGDETWRFGEIALSPKIKSPITTHAPVRSFFRNVFLSCAAGPYFVALAPGF